ncbi:cupin domain-containing protein [Flavobacterium taihuense]|uniref:Cupin domain-containing protein n=1 Tax=Flavobacterium taihuense TaxID=2857508 RepID=A0ABS6XVR1_9FLAO|nr:cupin domain-containing protein [Flavobacterium taihuense]MBW4360669.1 cupin domain-containing protein [Flavobacterium taihuense]
MKKIIFEKGILFAFITCITIGLISCNNGKVQLSDTEKVDAILIFPKGDKVTNANFSGNVWLNNLVQADSINQNAVGNVTFEAGARTKWHSHPSGQIILVLEGIGYYQEKGNQKIVVRKGDVVKCPANIPHWHGASNDSNFIQIAITGREKGETIWFDLVTDQEYNSKSK